MKTTSPRLFVATQNPLVIAVAALALTLAQACGSDGNGADSSSSKGPCHGDEPMAGCGLSCEAGAPPCLVGLYCSTETQTCTAECSEDDDCSDDKKCQTATGTCVEPLSGGDGGETDTCASFNFAGAIATPNVKLLIDRSGSMKDPFPLLCDGSANEPAVCGNSCSNDDGCSSGGGYCVDGDDNGNQPDHCEVDCDAQHPCLAGYTCQANGQCMAGTKRQTRWNVLRDSLTASGTGIIDMLDSRVRFGSAFYTASGSNDCPAITGNLPVAINNYTTVKQQYDMLEPGGNTPTGAALRSVADSFKLESEFPNGPNIIILATDGLPAVCNSLSQTGTQEAMSYSETGATYARMQGVSVYPIFIGPSDTTVESHMQRLGNLGAGKAADAAGQAYWPATDPAGLADAINEIITTNALSCTINLQGAVDPGFPCEGSVKLNGRDLQCRDTDDADTSSGWKLKDSSHLELLGTDCSEMKATPSDTLNIDVVFPCIQKIG